MSENKYSLINDDCLNYLSGLSNETIDLIYLDPPFFTQRTQKLSGKDGMEYQFDDSWDSFEDYLDFLRKRVIQMRRVLKKSGSLFFHCDNKASHKIKILLDEVFGEDSFKNEIVWAYKRWSNSKKGLLNSHQIIFYYVKTKEYKFNRLMVDYSPTTNIDQILQERCRDERNKAVYRQDENGNPVFAAPKKGVPLSDVWNIPFLNPKAKERTGYPTQKPINLLQRIIEISTDPGDIVLDPFCGSGTTLVASKLLGRSAIGIDINAAAIDLTQNRLDNPIKSTSFLLEKGENAYRKQDEMTLAYLKILGCTVVQRNKGIDGFLLKTYKRLPIPVKVQNASETFEQALRLLHNAARKKGCEKAVLIRTSTAEGMFKPVIPEGVSVIDSMDLQLNSVLDFSN